MTQTRRSSEDRQIELVDAALAIIATEGIATLSTRRLAEHVGLSSGAIFRHFSSLDALLEAVVARVETVLDATFPPGDLPARERLDRFVEARSKVVGKQVGILRLVLSEQFLLALPENGSSRLSSCVEKTRKFVHKCIHDGQKSGEFRGDVDPEALAQIVMGTIQMLAVSKRPPRRRSSEAKKVRAGLLSLLDAPTQKRTRKHSG